MEKDTIKNGIGKKCINKDKEAIKQRILRDNKVEEEETEKNPTDTQNLPPDTRASTTKTLTAPTYGWL